MSQCVNCGLDGPHFVPPSLGEPGFYTCAVSVPRCQALEDTPAGPQCVLRLEHPGNHRYTGGGTLVLNDSPPVLRESDIPFAIYQTFHGSDTTFLACPICGAAIGICHMAANIRYLADYPEHDPSKLHAAWHQEHDK